MNVSLAIILMLIGFAVNELHMYSVKKATKKAYYDGYKQARYEEEIRNGTVYLNNRPKVSTHYPIDESPKHEKHGKKKYEVSKEFEENFQNNGQATMILNNN